jgi:MFS transporter, DHA1 family, inner membrane transport protein
MDKKLLVLALGAFAIGTDSYVVAGILPGVAASFATSVAAAAQFVSVYSLSYGLLSPVMATLTARWQRRNVLLGGLALFVASNALTATAGGLGVALAGRALAGLGGAMFIPTASAVAAGLAGAERRGHALAVVLAGLSAATALGAPLGTLVGTLGNWRTTLWFVAVLATLAAFGVWSLVPNVATGPAPTLRQRLAPMADARIAGTLATTLLAVLGIFLVYTYLSVVFDRATHHDGRLVAALMSVWGVAATFGSLKAGALADRLGSRRVINIALALLALDFALMPWSGATLAGAAIALMLWGMCGWGFVASQQHRLVGIAPALASMVLALNASAIYLAIGLSGAGGALLLEWLDPHKLPLLGAGLLTCAFAAAEMTQRLLRSQARGRRAVRG